MSPYPPPVVQAVFDPHFTFHHGGRADFKGKDRTWYNLLSTANVSLNVLFTHADFHLVRPKPRLVHGSHMQALVATIRLASKRFITIEFNASAADIHRARVCQLLSPDGPYRMRTSSESTLRELGWLVATTNLVPGHGVASMRYHRSKKLEDLKITTQRKQVAGMASVALVIDTGNWEITAWSVPFPNTKAHPGQALLNVRVVPKPGYDPEKDPVAPHGIIGQSYDGDSMGVDGAVDEYMGSEVTTKAMAEGAIEGVAGDYKMDDKFGTNFTYSRFGLLAAAPRNVSNLTGKRFKAGANREAVANEYLGVGLGVDQ